MGDEEIFVPRDEEERIWLLDVNLDCLPRACFAIVALAPLETASRTEEHSIFDNDRKFSDAGSGLIARLSGMSGGLIDAQPLYRTIVLKSSKEESMGYLVLEMDVV